MQLLSLLMSRENPLLGAPRIHGELHSSKTSADSSRGRFSDVPSRIPEPRLSANNLFPGEVGVSANHRSPQQPREPGVLDRKVGVLLTERS